VKTVDLNQPLEETAETFGSTVSVFLPASGSSVMSDKRPAQAGRPGLKTILLVEDEEMVADIGQQMLERLGYKVLLARTGQDALLLYEEHHRDIDLVILDMVMPGMGGGDVFAGLKTINPEVAVLLSSGYIMNGQAREILNGGCKGFIQKPFSIEQLSLKIRELLSGKPGHGA
jgi:CheY-like chemotaxis protein